jgi:GNAT superfamily N-acetyltransferase
MADSIDLTFRPLTPERWPDLEALFGPRGASGGCWCMWWRLKRSDFDRQQGEGNRQALQSLVESGPPPGILAYAAEKPVGWCAISPRQNYPALERSRILQPVDDQPVWSVVCFFVARGYRRKGVSVGLLQAAVEYARQRGARIVEGYPSDPKAGGSPDVFIYTGVTTAFQRAGFVEVLRRSEHRPIMRYLVTEEQT